MSSSSPSTVATSVGARVGSSAASSVGLSAHTVGVEGAGLAGAALFFHFQAFQFLFSVLQLWPSLGVAPVWELVSIEGGILWEEPACSSPAHLAPRTNANLQLGFLPPPHPPQ